MAKSGREVTFIPNTPWARVQDPRIPGWAWVGLFRDSAQRIRVGTVVIDQSPRIGNPGGSLPITKEVLLAVDISSIEREANQLGNQPTGLDAEVEWKDVPRHDPIATLWKTLRLPNENRASVTVQITESDGTHTVIQSPPKRRRYRLTAGTPTGRIPDEYLARVVKAYYSAIEHGLYPAPTIAEDVGAHVNTVRSWIKKARARGLMAPGQRGRMG